ncbi:MAG: ankyrin repeat domain-containing protein [Candidatus Jidaibacter sp.]|nr:ankyrin repeat domain-containing protein [Candidatus Jidaibacter sp.]
MLQDLEKKYNKIIQAIDADGASSFDGDDLEYYKEYSTYRTSKNFSRTPLSHSVSKKYKNLQIIKLLVQHHTDLAKEEYIAKEALLIGLIYGDEELVKTLVNLNIYLFNTDNFYVADHFNGTTIDKTPVAKQIDNQNPFPQTKEYLLNWELYIALYYGHIEIAEFLIGKGANINAINKDGDTLLHIAVKEGNKKIAKFLLNQGADINAANKDGDRPLHIASKDKVSLKTLDILLKYHPDPLIKNTLNNTPIECRTKINIKNRLHSYCLTYITSNYLLYTGIPTLVGIACLKLIESDYTYYAGLSASLFVASCLFNGTKSKGLCAASGYLASSALLSFGSQYTEYNAVCNISAAVLAIATTYYAAAPVINHSTSI